MDEVQKSIMRSSDKFSLQQDIKKLVGENEELKATLSACRALLEKHQWAGTDEGGYEECPECKYRLIGRHAPDCAIAAEIKEDDDA